MSKSNKSKNIESKNLKLGVVPFLWLFIHCSLRVFYPILKIIDYFLFYKLKKSLGFAKTKIFDGEVNFTSKIAVFAAYSPKKIAESTYHYLRELKNNGFSILYISTSDINAEDLVKLRNLCCKIMIRPNYGADFGSYKEGILYILKNNVELDYLLMTNDSVWLVKDLKPTLDSIFQNTEHKAFGLIENMSMLYNHCASWFLVFNKDVYKDPKFKKFWEDFKEISNRIRIIHKGEIFFNSYLLNNNIYIKPLFPNGDVINYISNNYKTPEQFLELYVYSSNETADSINIETDSSAVDFLFYNIVHHLSANNVIGHYWYILNKMNFPFIKKDLVSRRFVSKDWLLLNINSAFDIKILQQEMTKLSLKKSLIHRILQKCGYR